MNIRPWTLILVSLALAGAAILLFGLGPEPDDTLARIRADGMIRIGYAVEPPYAFVTPKGEVTGESPEVAKTLVARLGIERIAWSQMAFSELIPALQTGRIDVIAAGLFVSEERAQQIRFSRLTFRVRPALLVAKGNPYGLRVRGQSAHTGSRRPHRLHGRRIRIGRCPGTVVAHATLAPGTGSARRCRTGPGAG